MKIVLTAPLEEPVPPAKYGGTELIVSLLAEEYTRLGHQVYLLAAGNSHTAANLVPILPTSIRTMPDGKSEGDWREYWKYQSCVRFVEEINRIKPDIIHNHYAWRFILFESLLDFPVMSTMHGPLTNVKETETYSTHSHHPYISISYNQRKAIPGINWIGTVYNGIDIDLYPLHKSLADRDYFLFLGRTSPEKGLAEIVKMISQTKHKLKIAAKIDEVDKNYFEEQVKPYIDGKQIEYVGEVGLQAKTELLHHAKALLLWLNWEEPFGLVVPEANACGVPVVVNRRGAMPELIDDGVTGYLVNTLDKMREKLDLVDRLDPIACRKRVEANYTSRLMAEQYLTLAEKTVSEFHRT